MVQEVNDPDLIRELNKQIVYANRNSVRANFNAQYGLRGRDAPPSDPEGIFRGVNIDVPRTINRHVMAGVPKFSQSEIERDLAIAKSNQRNQNFRAPLADSDRYDATSSNEVTDPELLARLNSNQYNTGNSFKDDVGNFFQGARKGIVDVGMGIRQRFDEGANYLESKFGGEGISRALPLGGTARDQLEDTNRTIEDRRRYYAPLMKTKAGLSGNVTGGVAASIPAAFVPGAATIKGSALIGATQGYLSPTTGNESAVNNAAIGGLLGASIPITVKGAQVAKGLLYDPFTRKGIEKSAADVMERYGIKPEHVSGVNSSPTITGSRPMLAEQIDDPIAAAGAARLRDNLSQVPGKGSPIGLRDMQNNDARLETLYDLAGAGGAKTRAIDARAAQTNNLYEQSLLRPVDLSSQKWAALNKTPAIKSALQEAQVNLQNQAMDINNPANTMRALDNAKKILDTRIRAASGAGGNAVDHAQVEGLRSAKTQLLEFMESTAPEYGVARNTFAQMSKPVNQMDVVERVIDKGTSPVVNVLSDRRIMPASMARVLDDEQQLIRQATGGKSSEKELRGLLDPEQYNKLIAVKNEIGRERAVISAGLGTGSQTAQRAIGLDLLNGEMGSLGGGLLGSIPKFGEYVSNKFITPKVQDALVDITLNPGKANAIMASLKPKERAVLQEAINNRLTQQAINQTLPALCASERSK